MKSPLHKATNALNEKNTSSESTIIFIHGNSASSRIWQNQQESKLLSKFNLLALDLPGHGKSFGNGAYSIPNLVETLVENINFYKSVVLVGHSLGGHLAIEILPHLKNCVALLISGTPPVKKPINLGEAFLPDERMALLFQKNLNSNEAKKFAECVCNNFQKQKFDVLGTIQNTDSKFREDIGISVAAGELADEVAILKNSTIPIAIFHGTEDALVNGNYLEELYIPMLWEGRIHKIKDSSHSPHLEQPDVFNQLLYDFLKDVL